MSQPTPFLPHTALILVDPFNDFLHPTGKLYPRCEASLTHNNVVANMERLVSFAHSPATRIPIFYALHQPHTPQNYAGWQHKLIMHDTAERIELFDPNTPNGEAGEGPVGGIVLASLTPDVASGDVIASRHWTHSSFNNTDLDFLLRQHEIKHVVLAGMETSTCLETTFRYAYELGYEVTVLRDGTAGFSVESWGASVNVTWELLPVIVVGTEEWIESVIQKQKEKGVCGRKKGECSVECEMVHVG